jgi:hypothetical protein
MSSHAFNTQTTPYHQAYPGAATASTIPKQDLQQPLLQPTAPHPHVAIDINEQRRKQKKQAGFSLCGIIALVVVLLLTFLIPRNPSIELSGGEVGLSGVPLYVNASFRFSNRNFYKTTFTNLHFGLYTLSDTGVGVIGDASFEGPIEVNARRHKTIQVGIKTVKGSALKINDYCKSHPSILMFLSNATVEATSEYRDFGTKNVFSPYGAFFMCPPPPPPSSSALAQGGVEEQEQGEGEEEKLETKEVESEDGGN